MKTLFFAFFTLFVAEVGAWDISLPGFNYAFPRDHFVHPAYKTEWWYFTGNLQDDAGKSYGFQVTFFRQGINQSPGPSHFAVRDLAFAHAALSEIEGKKFHFSQELSRMNFGEAGFGNDDRVAWINGWNLRLMDDGGWQFNATPGGETLQLTAEPEKSPVIHGLNGISQKAIEPGHASYYYSQTRLKMTGQIQISGRTFRVQGTGWFDHEWATNQLASDQVGWNWFGLHLTDGRDLMLYQMRRADWRPDPASSGTLIEKNGQYRHLRREDFSLQPLIRHWTSRATGANYPLDWEIRIPSANLAFTTRALLPDQEMNLAPVVYWEGATEMENPTGKIGRGYMELTGYGQALNALRGP